MAKTKYKEDFPALVEHYARQGMIEKDIAAMIGISVDTFEVYKRNHTEFSESLKAGKKVIDTQVESMLFKRAIGYEYDETHTTTVTKADGTVEESVKLVRKVMAPDVTAQIFWLKNRKPAEWRDTVRVETVDLNQAFKDAAKFADAERRVNAIDTGYLELDEKHE